MKRGRGATLLLGCLAAIALVSSGCAGASMAAGPLISALQAITGRSVERTLSADLETAWTATRDTLNRMDVHVRETDWDGGEWVLEGVGDEVTVHAKLVPVTPRMTRISLRAEGGKLFADKETAEEILNQVTLSLATPPVIVEREPASGQDGHAEELAALKEEIRGLKLVIEKTEADRVADRPQADPNEGTDAVVSTHSRIVTIPSSYGIRKLPVAAKGTNGSPPPVGPDERAAAIDDTPPADDGRQETLSAPLLRADVLAPIPAARASRHLPAIQP